MLSRFVCVYFGYIRLSSVKGPQGVLWRVCGGISHKAKRWSEPAVALMVVYLYS